MKAQADPSDNHRRIARSVCPGTRQLPTHFLHVKCLSVHSDPGGLPAESNLSEMASSQDSWETGPEESLGSGWAGGPNRVARDFTVYADIPGESSHGSLQKARQARNLFYRESCIHHREWVLLSPPRQGEPWREHSQVPSSMWLLNTVTPLFTITS